MSRSLGYRPSIPRVVRTPTEQRVIDNIDNLNAAIAAQNQNQAAREKAAQTGNLSFTQLVDLSKQDQISAVDLDRALTSIYSYGEELEQKATIASDFVAKTIEPVVLDKAFKEDTKADALLIFGKEIDQLTPDMIKCVNKIVYSSQDLVDPMERGDAESDAALRDKYTDLSSIDKVLDKIRTSAPKFGFEFLLLLILIILEEILKLILSPLCPIAIIGIRIGKMIANAIAAGVWLGTAHIVDVRDVCDCKDDPTPDCVTKYEEGIHSSIARRWDDIGPSYLRGDVPGFPTGDRLPPIFEDTNPDRKPNLFETQAALNIIKSFQNLAGRQSAADPLGYAKNGKYENVLAYMNTDAAKHAATSIKLTAGNMQDTLRVAANTPGSVSATLSLAGSPITMPSFTESQFGKNVTKSLNQILQSVKAVDRWIRSATSLAFLDSKLADLICCFIRLIFNYAIYLSQNDTSLNKAESDLKAMFGASPNTPFRSLEAVFKEVTQKQIQTDFNQLMQKSTDALKNDPRFNEAVKNAIKAMKLLEAIISAISSTITADLNFGVSLDAKKLREAMLAIIGKTMTMAVDVMMTEIRQPTEDFVRQIAADPRWGAALKECELFSLMTGMLACGLDAFQLTIEKMLEGIQRDSDGKWLQINASLSAAYNQKFAKFILDIINLIMNDLYLLFTICNIDTIYDPEQLKQSSLQVANALSLDSQIRLQFENQAYLDQVYSPLGGGVDGIQVGTLGTEAVDKVFSGDAMGFRFADPLNNTLSPLMKQDFSVLRPVGTSDGTLGRKYNSDVPVDPVAAIQDQLADRDCARCKTTDFISVPIVDRFDRTAYRGFS